MILTGPEIKENIHLGHINISPFVDSFINPNTYNYRLDKFYKLLNDNKTYEIPETGLIILPNRLYLMNTYEIIGSRKYAMLLNGRSSIGRLGIFVNADADLGHQGAQSKWTLEVSCVQPVKLYPLMKFGQVSFWEVEGEEFPYNGHYNNLDKPKHSKFSKI